MSSSENPPATKRHKGRHKRESLRMAQKGRGRCAKHLGHIDRQASGEGGIRTRGGDLCPHAALAKRCYRPLSHLSKVFSIRRLRRFPFSSRFSSTPASTPAIFVEVAEVSLAPRP